MKFCLLLIKPVQPELVRATLLFWLRGGRDGSPLYLHTIDHFVHSLPSLKADTEVLRPHFLEGKFYVMTARGALYEPERSTCV